MKNNVLEFTRPKKKMRKDLGRRIATAIFFVLFAVGVYLVTNMSFDDAGMGTGVSDKAVRE